MSPGAVQAVPAAPCEGEEWSLPPCTDQTRLLLAAVSSPQPRSLFQFLVPCPPGSKSHSRGAPALDPDG